MNRGNFLSTIGNLGYVVVTKLDKLYTIVQPVPVVKGATNKTHSCSAASDVYTTNIRAVERKMHYHVTSLTSQRHLII